LHWLKRIRIIFAIIFSVAISLLFLDYANLIPVGVRPFFVSFQLVPSLIRTLVVISSASLGLILVLILTLLFGRVYCSTICPLGILQDVVIRIANKRKKRNRFRYQSQYYLLHYGLLSLTVVLALLGSMVLLNLFEPFSYFGRIFSNLLSPVVIVVNNLFSLTFGILDLTMIPRIPILHIGIISIATSLGFLGLIVYLSYNHGRLFCNTLCPAGAFLGLLSRFSLFKIIIDENNCKDCGLCEKVCKASCIKSKEKKIDFSACIGCYNCIDACPTVGMSYKGRWKRNDIPIYKIDDGRRVLLKSSFIPMLGLLIPQVVADSISSKSKNRFSETKKNPISPPGSLGVDRFSSLCTACHLCISSCPTQVMYPASIEYGLSGLFQPRMNYDASYCNYDCVICGQVCPTGAILPLEIPLKKEVQIGKVEFIKDDCIVVSKKKDCGACSEHCPTKAVKMVPYEKKLMVPDIDNELCVGCGACEHACPVLPHKAIYVNANPIHQKAKKPQLKKAEPSFDSTKDFPF
jgi:ferredoxin